MLKIVTMLYIPVMGQPRLMEVVDMAADIQEKIGGCYVCTPLGKSGFWILELDYQKHAKFNRYLSKGTKILKSIKGAFLIAKANDSGEYVSLSNNDYKFLKECITDIGVYIRDGRTEED